MSATARSRRRAASTTTASIAALFDARERRQRGGRGRGDDDESSSTSFKSGDGLVEHARASGRVRPSTAAGAVEMFLKPYGPDAASVTPTFAGG